ncbi:anion permease [bacterium]|nr:anion permease [bacterium]
MFSFFGNGFLAYANGANDNFKGVSTLYGSGVASYRRALVWATLTTLLGALTAILLATGLLATFSGKGLVPEFVLSLPIFPWAVACAASLTVMLATHLGFPISTTHALTGGLVGAGWMASSEGIYLAKLGSAFVLPLLFSPLLALVTSALIFSALHRILKTNSGWLNRFHYLSAGAVCFSRAVNDTPKIAAILLAGSKLPPKVAFSFVASAMALGGLFHSRRIAETLSHKVTEMNESQGLISNITTAFLVIGASRLGLPVSTTHVACGSLFGMGMVTKQAHYRMILGIIFSWVITLPVATLLGALSFLLLKQSFGL